ncbi:MAG: PKD domain-containing protein, partial [Thermoplasmata archaeon]
MTAVHGGSEKGGKRVGSAVLAAVAVALVAVLLVPGGLPGASAPGAPKVMPRPTPADGSNGLEVTPAAAEIPSGSSVNLSADLTPTAQGCIPAGALITWTLGGATGFLGYLNTTGGSQVRFTSYPYGSGLVTITASGLGLMLCGSTVEVFRAPSTAVLDLLAPLGVGGLTADPDPAPPGSTVTLRVDGQGGAGPYRAHFDFGDGSNETVLSADPGGLFATHEYAAGTYHPTVSVLDALGESVEE